MNLYENLPDKVKEAIENPSNLKTVEKICQDNHVEDVDIDDIKTYTGFVLLGLIQPKDLLRELVSACDTDEKTLTEVVKNLNRDIFAGLADELSKINQTGEPDATIWTKQKFPDLGTGPDSKTISLEDIGRTAEESIPVETTPVTLKLKDQAADAPFIIHEEKVPEGNITSQKSVFRSVTSPLGGFFFKKRVADGETKPAIAKLEIPGLKPENRRIVHYSETRTPVGELEEPPFLNVGEVKPLTGEIPISSPENPVPDTATAAPHQPATITIKPKAEESPDKLFFSAEGKEESPKIDAAPEARNQESQESPAILGAIKKPAPKIDGNTIDLRSE